MLGQAPSCANPSLHLLQSLPLRKLCPIGVSNCFGEERRGEEDEKKKKKKKYKIKMSPFVAEMMIRKGKRRRGKT